MNVFLFPQAPGRLVLTSLPLGLQEALAASTELPASLSPPSGQASLVPVGTPGQMRSSQLPREVGKHKNVHGHVL